MPMSASEATREYREGVQEVGIDAYRRASNTNSPAEAAQILESAKVDNSLSIQNFAEKYQRAYTGSGGGGTTMG